MAFFSFWRTFFLKRWGKKIDWLESLFYSIQYNEYTMDSLLHDIEGMLRRNRGVVMPCKNYKVEKKVRVRNGIKRTVYSAMVEEPKKVVEKSASEYLALCTALEHDAWNENYSEKNILERYYALDHIFNNTKILESFSDEDTIAVCDAFMMAQMTIEKCFHTIL